MTSTPPPPEPEFQTAEDLLAAFVADQLGGEEQNFDSLCEEYPEQAGAMRRLLDELMDTRALAAGLSKLYGTRPRTRLRNGGDGNAGENAHGRAGVLERLASRGDAASRYDVGEEIAHGGMGSVLRVFDQDLRRTLAMKVMLDQREPTSGSSRLDRHLARFIEEAQVGGQLEHPGIVPVHELGLDADGRVYFTMKLVQGKTLSKVYREFDNEEGDWTDARVLGILLRVCEAMGYAHSKHVIHRDLKPSNVMVGSFGEVYVMDWGLAKPMNGVDAEAGPDAEPEIASDRRDQAESDPDSSLVTAANVPGPGTPPYMPPEQAAGRHWEMGPQADVYSVGAMLYQFLTGQAPYVPYGALRDNEAVLRSVQDGPPDSVQDLAPDTPGELVAICETAMARNLVDRYADMQELADDLRAFLEGRVVSAYETGAIAEFRKWVRRNKGMAGSLALFLLAVV